MNPRYTPILIDLDGTIVDSAPGITGSLAWMFEQLGMPVPSHDELLAWVGPPMLDSFRDLAGFNEAQSRHALGVYRRHYAEVGVLNTTPYPGMVEVLRSVHAAGIPLSLATSKPELMARRILESLGVSDAFTEITGASEDETRSAKADVVQEALRRLSVNHELERPIMVGDRIHDVEGAAAHKLQTIFVNWGYGSDAEAATALETVDTADQLLASLGL